MPIFVSLFVLLFLQKETISKIIVPHTNYNCENINLLAKRLFSILFAIVKF